MGSICVGGKGGQGGGHVAVVKGFWWGVDGGLVFVKVYVC